MIDRSSSMASTDSKPTLNFISNKRDFNNRLGVVYESSMFYNSDTMTENNITERIPN